MKIGFLFPGQGSQSLGMGKDLYDEYEDYRKVYDDVKKITGIDVAKLTFDENEDVLNQTKNTQLAILTMSLAILRLLENENINANASMGLSLGEYGALINSGALSFEDGIRTVKRRGELMQELCPEGNWSMAAVLGLDEYVVVDICNKIDGFVVPANFNCPGQIVISGEKEAIDKAIIVLKEAGAKKVIELKTAGPFHTEKLQNAATELRKEFDDLKFKTFKTTVIKNLDGKEYSSLDDFKTILEKHIVNPVRFEQGIQTMLDTGIDTFVEVGPGKALSGFVKRASKDVKVLNINNLESFNLVISELKKIGGKCNE